jgi:hypothetical protein
MISQYNREFGHEQSRRRPGNPTPSAGYDRNDSLVEATPEKRGRNEPYSSLSFTVPYHDHGRVLL